MATVAKWTMNCLGIVRPLLMPDTISPSTLAGSGLEMRRCGLDVHLRSVDTGSSLVTVTVHYIVLVSLVLAHL